MSVPKAKRVIKAKTTLRLTARAFLDALTEHKSASELKKYHHYFDFDEKSNKGDQFLGVRMGTVFALAKRFQEMSLAEIEKLLESRIHEARAGAISIMDFQSRDKKTSTERRKELFDLYMRRHDRINNWDLVDRSAPYVVGGYLADKPRKILYKLALSKDPWERRTAIVSTYYFIRKKDLDDTFQIGELLINDPNPYVNKATGGWLREAGKQDSARLQRLLDKYAPTMPRITLRYAIEKFDKRLRDKYLKMGKGD